MVEENDMHMFKVSLVPSMCSSMQPLKYDIQQVEAILHGLGIWDGGGVNQ